MTPGSIRIEHSDRLPKLTADLLKQTAELKDMAYAALETDPKTAAQLDRRLSKRYTRINKEPSA